MTDAAAPSMMNLTLPHRVMAGIVVLGLALVFYDSIQFLVEEWDSDQYSHGALIPVVSVVIAWMKREEIKQTPVRSSWWGVVVLTMALMLAMVGKIATIYFFVHMAIVIATIGAVLAFFGTKMVATLWMPLFYLFFMIPLPDFLLVKISAQMQLWSTMMGVDFIRLFGISVFSEGNIIDLGQFKMQVVEACNGLRYLFPLMSFGFLLAYLYRGPLWQRLLIFLLTIPITVIMNSLRIGLIGVFHEFYSVDLAKGLLHDFQGWAVFIACLIFLLLAIRLLMLVTRQKGSFVGMFALQSGRS